MSNNQFCGESTIQLTDLTTNVPTNKVWSYVSVSGDPLIFVPSNIATSPKIIRIDKRESYRRFFLVIGSFGSEEETVRYIQRPENKFSEYYLVLPFEENSNYRLAIGAYRNWDEASAKLTEMKAQNAKGYWILNY